MSTLDWIIMMATLLGIVTYGVWKTRHIKTAESYLRGTRSLKWWTIGLSIMATQASAITFLSTPGQAYDDGMRFVQFYFGLPIAMILLSAFVLPLFYKLKVYTAYEFLEGRFNLKTRQLTAFLFLLQRGLAAGITIYAPAIILSSLLQWDLKVTNLVIGALVIIYTVSGGTHAVSQTQKQQMIVILVGMFITGVMLVRYLPQDISFNDAVQMSGKMGKLNIVDFRFDLKDRYTFWTGILGGTFLFLSYFGTDQSQVQRYLSGKSLTESRLGLMFNGLLKVPMQFLVLFVGILTFAFFQFEKPPVHFNQANVESVIGSPYEGEYRQLEDSYDLVFEEKQEKVRGLINAQNAENEQAVEGFQKEIRELEQEERSIRAEVDGVILKSNPKADVEDTDYVFLSFVINFLPVGLVGLLLAVILSAAMSSISSEVNALATTTTIDFYKRSWNKDRPDAHYLLSARLFTVLWGIIAVTFAMYASLFENLIEAVNIIGSLFYGSILGIFLVAFFFKKISGNAVFAAALLAEVVVLIIFWMTWTGKIELAYLWLNAIGCGLVILFGTILELLLNIRRAKVQ